MPTLFWAVVAAFCLQANAGSSELDTAPAWVGQMVQSSGKERAPFFEELSKTRRDRILKHFGLDAKRDAPSLVADSSLDGSEKVRTALTKAIALDYKSFLSMMRKPVDCEKDVRKLYGSEAKSKDEEVVIQNWVLICTTDKLKAEVQKLNSEISKANEEQILRALFIPFLNIVNGLLSLQRDSLLKLSQKIKTLPPARKNNESDTAARLALDCQLRQTAMTHFTDAQTCLDALYLVPEFARVAPYARVMSSLMKARDTYDRIMRKQMDGRIHGACPR